MTQAEWKQKMIAAGIGTPRTVGESITKLAALHQRGNVSDSAITIGRAFVVEQFSLLGEWIASRIIHGDSQAVDLGHLIGNAADNAQLKRHSQIERIGTEARR